MRRFCIIVFLIPVLFSCELEKPSLDTFIADPDIIFNSDLSYGSINDTDGNIYKTIKIGDQTWLAENLRTTKYNDGTSIPHVKNNVSWISSNVPAYCWYDNNMRNKNIYGALYNWYTINTEKLCPCDWHVPTDAEWTILVNYISGLSGDEDKLKEIGTLHWNAAGSEVTNQIGFTALPAGYRNWENGHFMGEGGLGFWWTSSQHSESVSWAREIENRYSGVFKGIMNNNNGLSVRCIKD
ncbi:MAG: fibrobacter succinogenes major paralogous domain-containing protein [Bacteroidales bacterium]|nr:fibrobacter succinogenes major paralogous domain-containing protein [Bacteroidales bacterium]